MLQKVLTEVKGFNENQETFLTWALKIALSDHKIQLNTDIVKAVEDEVGGIQSGASNETTRITSAFLFCQKEEESFTLLDC